MSQNISPIVRVSGSSGRSYLVNMQEPPVGIRQLPAIRMDYLTVDDFGPDGCFLRRIHIRNQPRVKLISFAVSSAPCGVIDSDRLHRAARSGRRRSGRRRHCDGFSGLSPSTRFSAARTGDRSAELPPDPQCRNRVFRRPAAESAPKPDPDLGNSFPIRQSVA